MVHLLAAALDWAPCRRASAVAAARMEPGTQAPGKGCRYLSAL